jgi:hypothetical protein
MPLIAREQLESQWKVAQARPPTGTIEALVVRRGNGIHAIVPAADLTPIGGFAGDRWAREPDRTLDAQISLMDSRVLEVLVGGDRTRFDVPGDNLIVDLDLSEGALPTGTRLQLGSATIEVTPEPHTGCKKFHARLGGDALRWVNAHENRALRLRGIYARVLTPGSIAVGDRISLL